MFFKKKKRYSSKLRRKIDCMHFGKMYYDSVERRRKRMFGE